MLSINKIIEVVAYLRLSVEDGDTGESVSISNQRKIIEEYAKENGMVIKEFYIDDGYSGYTMNRPSFDELKEDLNSNKVSTIIVKDLSRIGRHSPMVQLFLENILKAGKRVIAIGDSYDTFDEASHDMVGIKTWFNERYVVDTSKKIKRTISTLQKEGNIIAKVPYGYMKDPFYKTKYMVDPLVAPYVKQIFDMYINGLGYKQIAKDLTEMNIPTPSMIQKQYTEERGAVARRKVSTEWDVRAVSRILKNDFYIGTLTLGKSKTRTIRGKQIQTDKDDWHIFENAHEAIIDKETFNLAQEIAIDRSNHNYRGKRIQKRANLFSGLLYCADCGKRLTSSTGGDNTRYVCKTYNIYGTSMCTNHAINENTLKIALTEVLSHCKHNLEDVIRDLDQILRDDLKSRKDTSDSLDKLEKRLVAAQDAIKTLIEQKLRETMKNPTMIEIIDKTYDAMQQEKYQEIKSIEKQINDLKETSANEMDIRKGLNSAMNIINEIIRTKEFAKKQVLMIVDKITVYDDGGVDIYLKGNLQAICKNHFKLSDHKMDKIKKHLYDFILQNPERIVTRDAAMYIRAQGVPLVFDTLSEIVKTELLENNIVKRRQGNHGYALISDIDTLSRKLLSNTVLDNTRWECDNSVIIETANHICKWIKSISYKNNRF